MKMAAAKDLLHPNLRSVFRVSNTFRVFGEKHKWTAKVTLASKQNVFVISLWNLNLPIPKMRTAIQKSLRSFVLALVALGSPCIAVFSASWWTKFRNPSLPTALLLPSTPSKKKMNKIVLLVSSLYERILSNEVSLKHVLCSSHL